MIVRVNKTTNYTVIGNNIFKDKNLSLKARGLLTTILSLPDNWKYSIEGLASLCADGRASVTSAINELIEAGYIIRTQKFDDMGKFSGYIYDIYEETQGKIADLSFAGNTKTGNPITENQQVLNTNLLNTNTVNTNNIVEIPPISPVENLFEQFWVAYPQCFRKANKKGCKAKFLKIKNLESIFPDIMNSLELQKRSKQWNEQDGQFIPAPLTWINQERWTIQDTRTERKAAADNILQSNIADFL